MDNKKRWELLLGEKRFREKTSPSSIDGRNPFENDYGRLVSSAPIRRLQDKTQVFPLEKSDYIRTRLTHSMEVAYIGSSIGQSIEKFLIQDKKDLDQQYQGYLSSLLRVAGLVHDLGNPPFGHFGEEAVKKFFSDYFNNNNNNITDLNQLEKADFTNFDGNAQTFRILSKLYYFGDQYGYNLTFSSLASIIKYPSNSVEGNKKPYTEIAKKKFGYFVTETESYKAINDWLKLGHKRSPAVYLLEAADDIAYSAADIEDGVKLGIITISDIKKIFSENLVSNRESVLTNLAELESKYKADSSLIVQRFRIKTQQIMIEKVVEAFKANYDEIMTGDLQDEIINISDAKDIRNSYKALQSIIFNNKGILKKEIAGWEAIYGLLKIFVKASQSENFKSTGNTYESRLYNIISSSYRKIYEQFEVYQNKHYTKLRLIVDFIVGMTDSYAIDLYQELKGIKL